MTAPASGFAIWTGAAHQMAVARRMMLDEYTLDQREDECWRMFGITVDYCMDERTVTCGAR